MVEWKTRIPFWSAAVAVALLTSCGGSTDEVSTPDTTEAPAVAQETGEAESGATPEPEASTTTIEATTTTAEASESFTADDAIKIYDDYTEALEDYIKDSYVDGDGVYDDAVAVIERGDPELLEGTPSDIAIEYHNCVGSNGVAVRALGLTGISISVDHLNQQQFSPDVWAIEVLQTASFEGVQEQVTKATQIVTPNGLGPVVVTTGGESSCPLPRSEKALALIDEVAAFLEAS